MRTTKEQRAAAETREECARIVERCLSFGQLKLIGHGLAAAIRRGAVEEEPSGLVVTREEMATAILAFCERADDLRDPDSATREAFRRLIVLGNRLRPKAGKHCGNQNDDYPGLRCARRPGHRGRHANPSRGASW